MSKRGKNRSPTARRADSAVVAALPIAAPSAGSSPRPGSLWASRLPANWIIGLLLAASVFLVFGQTARHKFINFDDDEYVYENREVRAGLTQHGLRAAFLRPLGVNWHPLTTLSHMLDCQLYGTSWPGGHHLTNVALHAATAIGLYLALRRMTARTARSAFAALLFAVHPLRVESVAWIAERKDVLSGLFFVLTLWAYAAYVQSEKGREQGAGNSEPGARGRAGRMFPWGRYAFVLWFFALGLLCKPMLVTLPFVLLLLDYWPLRRFEQEAGNAEPGLDSKLSLAAVGSLLLEKLPLFILSGCSCAITLFLQASAMPPLQKVTLAQRLGNCLLAYAGYLKMFFWPFGLAVYYPYSESPPNPWAVAAAGVVLLSITLAVWVWRRQRRYLLVGWLWYLGTLVPVIGLIQVGYQSMADRYTYLPQIGPAVALVWLVADAADRSVNRRFAFSAAGSLGLLFLAACSAWQAAYWRDDLTLWSRTLRCTTNNCVAHLHLGLAQYFSGDLTQAKSEYEAALRDKPDFAEANFNLASILSMQGNADAAQEHYRLALLARPRYAKAHNNLGMLLFDRGELAPAKEHFQEAIDADPQYAVAENNLGIALMVAGQDAQAVAHYRRAIELDPDFVQPHANLGHALGRLGNYAEAVAEIETALRGQPDNPTILAWLAWVLATARDDAIRDGQQALTYAKKAAELTHDSNPRILDALAAACAETAQFPAAVQTAAAALHLAKAAGDGALAADIQGRIELYRRAQPFRE